MAHIKDITYFTQHLCSLRSLSPMFPFLGIEPGVVAMISAFELWAKL